MYHPLGDLLTTIYSLCFPIDPNKPITDEQKAHYSNLQRSLQRIEDPDKSTKLTIDEIIEASFSNIGHIFSEQRTKLLIFANLRSFLSSYTKDFIFKLPCPWSKEKTEAYLLKFYLPTAKELCEECYIQFSELYGQAGLGLKWYVPRQSHPHEPFARVIQWIITRSGKSNNQIAKDAAQRVKGSEEAALQKLKRWKSGRFLPRNVHECLTFFGLQGERDGIKAILYLSIIVSTYFGALDKSIDIPDSLFMIEKKGTIAYLNSFSLGTPDDLGIVYKCLWELFKKADNKDQEILSDLESCITSNAEAIKNYYLDYMVEAIKGRIYLYVFDDYPSAIEHYLQAFELGKYRAGRFQKQYGLEALHCIATVGDKVLFKRLYHWLRLYDHFLSNPLSDEDVGLEKAMEYSRGGKYIYLAHFGLNDIDPLL